MEEVWVRKESVANQLVALDNEKFETHTSFLEHFHPPYGDFHRADSSTTEIHDINCWRIQSIARITDPRHLSPRNPRKWRKESSRKRSRS